MEFKPLVFLFCVLFSTQIMAATLTDAEVGTAEFSEVSIDELYRGGYYIQAELKEGKEIQLNSNKTSQLNVSGDWLQKELVAMTTSEDGTQKETNTIYINGVRQDACSLFYEASAVGRVMREGHRIIFEMEPKNVKDLSLRNFIQVELRSISDDSLKAMTVPLYVDKLTLDGIQDSCGPFFKFSVVKFSDISHRYQDATLKECEPPKKQLVE